MARTQSLNYHIELSNGYEIHPKSLGEFGQGEEGRIDVADGSRKYKTRDNIWDIGEIEVEIYLRKDWNKSGSEFQLMEAWSNNNVVTDIYIIGTDITNSTKIVYLLEQCELAKGKVNAFDRNSKAIDSVKYYILPQNVDIVGNGTPNPAPNGRDFGSGGAPG